jgi:hypothetical protein
MALAWLWLKHGLALAQASLKPKLWQHYLQWLLESEEDVKTPILIPSGPPQLREDDIEPLTI